MTVMKLLKNIMVQKLKIKQDIEQLKHIIKEKEEHGNK